MLIIIAIAAGVAVALQGRVMGAADRAAGTAASVFVTYGTGGLLAAIYFLTSGANLRKVPWFSWSAGILGLVIVAGIGYAAPRLGLAKTLVITVAAQLLAATLLEQSFDLRKAAGLALTIAGVWLTVKA
ncbi:MAG TPA: DMT family transporter [Thermoanaerobaculia bacterium]